jgi:hypothetical protein
MKTFEQHTQDNFDEKEKLFLYLVPVHYLEIKFNFMCEYKNDLIYFNNDELTLLVDRGRNSIFTSEDVYSHFISKYDDSLETLTLLFSSIIKKYLGITYRTSYMSESTINEIELAFEE